MRKVIFASELPRKIKNFREYLNLLGKKRAEVLLNTRKQIMKKAEKDALSASAFLKKNPNGKIPFPLRRGTNCLSNTSMRRNKFQ